MSSVSSEEVRLASPQTAANEPSESVGDRLLASGCALAVCAAFVWATDAGLLRWNGVFNRIGHTLTIVGLIALVTAALPWMDAKKRPLLVLAGSIAAGLVITRWLFIVPLLFAWLTIRVSRSSLPTWGKLALLLGTWLSGVLVKWSLAGRFAAPWHALSTYWTCLPAAIVCLVVDRARGALGGATRRDELTYLLAIPRFFMPFLQPLPAASFVASRQPRQTPRLALSALGLGLFAVACMWVIQHVPYSIKPAHQTLDVDQHGPLVAQNLALVYSVNASVIFCAVALLRLLGFSLGSGFRRPLFASSPNDLFRRWNYYYYEFAFSYLYVPFIGWLRRRLPLWLAHIVAAYGAIVFGVWALDNVIYQLAFGWNLEPLLGQVAHREELLGYLIVWSFIVVPSALPGLRGLRRRRWWRVAARVATLALWAGLLTLLFAYQVTMY